MTSKYATKFHSFSWNTITPKMNLKHASVSIKCRAQNEIRQYVPGSMCESSQTIDGVLLITMAYMCVGRRASAARTNKAYYNGLG